MRKFDVMEWAKFGAAYSLVWIVIALILGAIISILMPSFAVYTIAFSLIFAVTLVITGVISWIIVGFVYISFVEKAFKYSKFWEFVIASMIVTVASELIFGAVSATSIAISLSMTIVGMRVMFKIVKYLRWKLPGPNY